jgi:hypothetical protein
MTDTSTTRKVDELDHPIEAHRGVVRLRVEIQSLEARLAAARAYSGETGANLSLVGVLQERLSAEHGDLAARLRGARRRAHRRLGLIGEDGDSAVWVRQS